jgi:cytochrome P450
MIERSPRWTATGPGEDIADPRFYTGTRHFEVWQQARRDHPIAWAESGLAGGFWSVTGHALGNEVLRQPGTFWSTEGMRLGSSPAAVRAAAGRMLVVSDGAAHRMLRAALSTWFTGRSVATLHPELERTVDDLLRGILARGTQFDVVEDLAVRVPMWVLFEMMGVPEADRDELMRLTAAGFDTSDSSSEAAQSTAHTAIFAYFVDLMYQRRARPGPDMVTSLVQAEVDGRTLTDEEIILNCDGLLNGGLETTPHAISGAILAFAEHPDAWQRLRDDDGLTDTAVDEILRWTSPPMHAMRTATAGAAIGPAQIQRGDQVVVWLPSCNRDEAAFPAADEFRVDRRPNPHICFGAGPHYCIGGLLARLELKCFLAALRGLVASMEVTAEPVRQQSNFLHGLARLEVQLKPAPGAILPGYHH